MTDTDRSFPTGLVAAALLAGAVVILAASPATAQPFPTLGGLEVRVGAAFPKDASTGPSASLDLDLGSLGIGSLRVIAGGNYFRADVDRAATGDEGNYSAAGARAGLRLDVLPGRRLTPFLRGTVTGHWVSADVADARTQDLLGGFYSGVALGGGAAWAFDSAGRTAVTAEYRRVVASNIGHSALEVGLRWLLRGGEAYDRTSTADRSARAEEARMRTLRLEAEQQRVVAEREAALRAERERAADSVARAERASADEAEARRLAAERSERERMDAARVAAERTERERLDAQRQAAQLETATERARADSLARVAREQTLARERAERATEAARADANEAARAARDAESRAAEAEERLYTAMVDLDRLITNVTAVRETERGLVVVLGQGLFASGQGDLSSRARDEVGRIAAVLQQFPEKRIAVEGHTDAVGSETANEALSERRAAAVRAGLIAQGIDPARADAEGFGERRPLGGNDTAAGRAENRRVEIVVLGARRPSAVKR